MTTQAITTQQIDINTILNTLIMLMVVVMMIKVMTKATEGV
jgi:hypothetical protein